MDISAPTRTPSPPSFRPAEILRPHATSAGTIGSVQDPLARSLGWRTTPEQAHAQRPILESLSAPRMDAHAMVAVRCQRPKRTGTYRAELESVREQVIAHHYGHGGSGWTLGPGAVERCVQDVCNAHPELDTNDEAMTVVGAGCIGLFTALRLAERFGGERVRVIAEEFNNLTSHNAGGLLAPISVQAAPAQKINFVADARQSLAFWQGAASGSVAHFQGCARKVPVYVGEGTDSGHDVYYPSAHEAHAGLRPGYLPRPSPILVQFDTGGLHNMWRQSNVFIDTQKSMQALTRRLEQLGVTFSQQRVRHFDELETRMVFNTTGLGANTLANDAAVHPVWGHLLALGPQPRPDKLDYMIYTTALSTPPDRTEGVVRDACYFMPKNFGARGFGVVGGTFVPGQIDEREHLRLIDGVEARARRFFAGR